MAVQFTINVKDSSKTKESYEQHIINSFEVKGLADVIFEVAPNANNMQSEKEKFFSCVGALFAIHSNVFSEMIFGVNLNRKDQNVQAAQNRKTIKLKDIDCKTFVFLRSYVYGLNPQITNDNIVDVLYCANTYNIIPLKDLGIGLIIKHYFDTLTKVNNKLNNNGDNKINEERNNNKISELLQLLIHLYYKGLGNVVETILFPKLKNVLNLFIQSKEDCMKILNNDYFYQLPLKLFELFMFDKQYNVINIVKNKRNESDVITEDILWDICVKWSKIKREQSQQASQVPTVEENEKLCFGICGFV